ncbi:MAG: hypothetical protein ACYS9X_30470 [Planctomycetota bacterium]|jgi:hypothetical protein
MRESLAALVLSCALADGLYAQDRQGADGAAQLPGDRGELVGKVVRVERGSVTVLPKGTDTPVAFRAPRMGGGVDRKGLIRLSKQMKRLREGSLVRLDWFRRRGLYVARIGIIGSAEYLAYRPKAHVRQPEPKPVPAPVSKPGEPAGTDLDGPTARPGGEPSIEEMLAVIDVMSGAEKTGRPATPTEAGPGAARPRPGSDMDIQLAQIEESLLSKPVEAFQGRKGISVWQSTSKAWQLVMVNSTATRQVLEATVGPRSFNVHPPNEGAVGVAWRSPMDGTLTINGRLTDSHAGGDSVAWKLHLLSDRGVTPLAAGAIAPLGRQKFSDVTSDRKPLRVPVSTGDIIQLTVLPKRAYICDLTRVEWILGEVGGQRRKWDVTRDLVPDLIEDGKGNPHRDSYGNRNVWYFFDVTSERILR